MTHPATQPSTPMNEPAHTEHKQTAQDQLDQNAATLALIAQHAATSRAVNESFFATQASAIAQAAQMIAAAMKTGHKLLLFGNGGSAADAQHIATELAFRMGRMRAALPALALTTDSSLLTAVSNDAAFEFVFARQLQALGQPGDVALAISTSGNSPNIIAALTEANQRGLTTIGLLGNNGGAAASLVNLALIVPHHETPRIQEVHITVSHIICQLIEDTLCPSTI